MNNLNAKDQLIDPLKKGYTPDEAAEAIGSTTHYAREVARDAQILPYDAHRGLGVRERVMAHLEEGIHPLDAAKMVGTAPAYAYRLAKANGVPYEQRRRGARRRQELAPLSPWHEALGRWIDQHLRDDFLLEELRAATLIPMTTLRSATAGTTELTATQLIALARVFGEPLPEVIFARPRFQSLVEA